jgi:hypothetical protein
MKNVIRYTYYKNCTLCIVREQCPLLSVTVTEVQLAMHALGYCRPLHVLGVRYHANTEIVSLSINVIGVHVIMYI